MGPSLGTWAQRKFSSDPVHALEKQNVDNHTNRIVNYIGVRVTKLLLELFHVSDKSIKID